MTGATEMGGSEAEVDGDGAAVAALVLQEVCSVLGADLKERKCFLVSVRAQEYIMPSSSKE